MADLKPGDVCILKNKRMIYRVFLIIGHYDEEWWDAMWIATTYLFCSDLHQPHHPFLLSKVSEFVKMSEIHEKIYI